MTTPKPKKAITVCSRPEKFRRAGHEFSKEPTTIAVEDLSKEALKALRDEPQLIVVDSEIEEKAKEA